MPKIESLKNYIDELISEVEKELDESTATGDIAGYDTPNAFSDDSDATKRRKKKIATQMGMQLVGKVESVSEATTSFVSGNSGRTITHLDNKKYQLTKDVKGAQIGNYHSVVLPKGSIIHNLPGGVFVSHPSLKDRFSGIKETPKFGFRVTTNSDTLLTIEKSSKILESVNESGYSSDDLKVGSVIQGQRQFSKLKGIQNGMYYKVVDIDIISVTVVPSDKNGRIKGSKKVRYAIYDIEAGIRNAIRGDGSGITIIKESVNEYNLNDIIKQVKTYDKPKDAKLLTIKVINKLKDSRNKANSSKKIEIQKVIDAIEGEYNKGKYLKLESVNEAELKLGVKYVNKQGKEGYIQTGGSNNPTNWFWSDGKTKHPYDKVKKELKPSKDQKKTGFGDYLKQGGRVWDNVNPSNSPSIDEGKVKRPVNRWLELKNDESTHANKKLAVGLRELKNQLKEVETFFRWYNQIKTMNELDSNQYWKRTNSHIYKIKERIINIARTLKEIEQ